MKKVAIEIKNLTYSFDEYVALDDVSFDVHVGDIVAIIGPNGSGKTTLLKNITGLYTPSSGSVKLLDKNPKDVRKKIGYVPQKFEFDRKIPISVQEFMSLERCGESEHSQTNITKVLKDVGLKKINNQKLGTLSGGQFQRVMIARALLHKKEILIFDEPSTGIDIKGEETIYDLIVSINKKYGTTCLIVSHELNVVSKYANHVICLNKKMVCYGSPEVVINPEVLKKLYGLGAGLYHSH